MQKKAVVWLTVVITYFAFLGIGIANATCPTLPYNLTNGQPADATQVMANYGSVMDCINAAGTVSGGTSGQLGYYGASGNAIVGKSLSDALDAAVGSARGDILYRGAGGWVALAPGTSGYVLQTGGASGDPSWAPAGGGTGGVSTVVGAGVSSVGPLVALPTPVISRPTLASLTWLNQASASATDNANGPLVLKTTQSTGGSNLNALTKSVAGADWTITIQYALGNHTGGTNLDLSGIIVRNNSTNRIYVCGITNASAISVWSYTSQTAWNSSVANKTIVPNIGNIWTRASYQSATTTITFSYSIDGYTWETIYTTTSPFVGVATDYGITVGSQGNSSGLALSLNYMKDSSP